MADNDNCVSYELIVVLSLPSVAIFMGLALVMFPYIIPTQITTYETSADPSSLVIMIIFVGTLIPVMSFYNLYSYVVFRGKVAGSSHE